MKLSSYLQTFKGAKQANKLGAVVILISLLMNLILVFSVSNKDTVVVMAAPLSTQDEWLSKGDASMGMKESWAQYIAILLGNTTPRSVAGVSPIIGRIASPGAYSSLMGVLAEMQREIEQEQLEIQFTPNDVRYIPSRDIVAVSGEMRMRGIRGDEKRFLRTYEVGLRFRNYMPQMTSLDVYEGPFKISGAQPEEERR